MIEQYQGFLPPNSVWFKIPIEEFEKLKKHSSKFNNIIVINNYKYGHDGTYIEIQPDKHTIADFEILLEMSRVRFNKI